MIYMMILIFNDNVTEIGVKDSSIREVGICNVLAEFGQCVSRAHRILE